MRHEVLQREAVRVSMATSGGISYAEVFRLPWDEYETILDEIRELNKRSKDTDG